MTSSRPASHHSRADSAPRQVPAPANSRAGLAYTRFIPREELRGFAAWQPDAFGHGGGHAGFTKAAGFTAAGQGLDDAPPRTGHPADLGSAARAGRHPVPGAGPAAAPDAAAATAPAPDAARALAALRAELQAEAALQVAAARAQGYQDGYRDGLVALDSFKQSFASQTSAQVGQVLAALDHELGTLEQSIASRVARVATELARQVVRSELAVHPALVAQVAREAINAVLMSARQITVLVHPDDHALVASGCAEALAARGARLLSQPSVARGGCRVESDAGVVDARIAARWAQASHALGTGLTWDEPEADAAAHTRAGADA